jgi:hypothetical protein
MVWHLKLLLSYTGTTWQRSLISSQSCGGADMIPIHTTLSLCCFGRSTKLRRHRRPVNRRQLQSMHLRLTDPLQRRSELLARGPSAERRGFKVPTARNNSGSVCRSHRPRSVGPKRTRAESIVPQTLRVLRPASVGRSCKFGLDDDGWIRRRDHQASLDRDRIRAWR